MQARRRTKEIAAKGELAFMVPVSWLVFAGWGSHNLSVKDRDLRRDDSAAMRGFVSRGGFWIV